jgi:threonine/homoserine/homoserine lactone efflux protein
MQFVPLYVDSELLLAFAVAAGVLIAIPGPSVVFVIGRALSYGRTVALTSVLGNTLGLAVVMTLVALGLGVVVSESVVVFTVVKLVGAAYLVHLGIKAIRTRNGFQSAAGPAGAGLPTRAALRQGFVVGISNPKAFMIFGALLPQFVDRPAGHVQLQMLVLGSVAVLIGLASDSLWALLASRVRDWFAATPTRGRALGLTGGLSMVGLGAALAVSGRPEPV